MPDNNEPRLGGLPLKTLSESGKPPESRLTDPSHALDLFRQLEEGEKSNNSRDAKIEGIWAGNPPYKQATLRKYGMSYRHNFSSRIGEAFLSTALTQYHDVVSSPEYLWLVR